MESDLARSVCFLPFKAFSFEKSRWDCSMTPQIYAASLISIMFDFLSSKSLHKQYHWTSVNEVPYHKSIMFPWSCVL